MKIRDLRTYIADRCNIEEPDLSLLGDSEEPFLRSLWGDDKSVESLIEESANFAQHSEEQLFYEFVQNAFDANATDLFFYVNREYLIVLNNGEPFYTDKKVKGEEPRDGQLYNFLAKNKSIKYNRDDKLGQHGQGSKLLYTLLIDDSVGHNRPALIKAIRDEKKGPVLISWANSVQLQNFLLDRYDWTYETPYDDRENLLVAKIVLSYYPIMPGIDESLFSEKDYHRVVAAFKDLVDPKRNENRLKQGTALIIPLGEGQYEKIFAKQNKEKVLARLGTFASIQKDKMHNVSKKLERIYVFGNETELRPVASIHHSTKIKGEEYNFHFAFHPDFADDNCVNFFKALPILQTRYHLGFIIDSQDFDTDPSRQRLLFQDTVAEQMSLVFPEILKQIISFKKTDPDKFYIFYSSLLSSKILIDDNDEIVKLKAAFEATFKPFLCDNVLSISGNYIPLSKARCSKTFINFDLRELGIDQFEWINKEVGEMYQKNIGVHIAEGTVSELVCVADTNKLIRWIAKIRPEVYKKFHKACIAELWHDTNYQTTKLFRSNKGNLYSKTEILSSSRILFFNDVVKKDVFEAWDDAEFIEEPITLMAEPYLECLYNKIAGNESYFASTNASKELACTILSLYVSISSAYDKKDKVSRLAILSNRLGQRVSFDQLFYSRPDSTVLFDNFMVKGYLPQSASETWFVTEKNRWKWIENNFTSIVALKDWDEMSRDYIHDIVSTFKARPYLPKPFPTSIPQQISFTPLSLYLSEDGIPVATKQFKLKNNGKKLSEDEYNLIKKTFPSSSLCYYKNLSTLTQDPFKLDSLSVEDLVVESSPYSLDVIQVFFKLEPDILDKWFIVKESRGYSLHKLGGKDNYISADLSSLVRNCLKSGNFVEIPEEVIPFIKEDKKESYIPSSVDFLKKAIDRCPYCEELLPLVEKSDETIKYKYLNKITLWFDQQPISEEDIRWRVLNFGIQNQTFRSAIFSKIQFCNNCLPSSVKKSEIKLRSHEYNVYDLNKDIEKANADVESFLSILPDRKAFKDAYYAATQEDVTKEFLYNALNKRSLSVVQLQFCIDYSIDQNMLSNTLCLSDNNNLTAALDMLLNEKYTQFDKYFSIPGFNKSTQIFAESNLLVEEEKLPTVLYNWLVKNETAVNLIDGLQTSDNYYIKIRKSILDNSDYRINVKDFSLNLRSVRNTVLWLRALGRTFAFGEPAFKTTMDIINSLDDNYTDLPMLSYTGILSNPTDEEKTPVPLFMISDPVYNSYFVHTDRSSQIHNQLVKSENFRKMVRQNGSFFITPSIDFLTRHRLNKKHVLRSEKSANDSSSYKEWEDAVYLAWKEKTSLSIWLSPQKISSYFCISCLDDIVYKEARDESDMGYQYKKRVIIKYPNNNNLSVLKNLELAAQNSDLDWFLPDFVQLQGMFLDKLEQLQSIANEKGTTIESVIDSSANHNSQNNQSSGNITVSEDKREYIQLIADSLEPDVLELISKNVDLVLDALEGAMDKEPESKVRQIIGYIGEQIYELYLKDKLKIRYENVADQGKGEYDFVKTDENVYIDVKTNLYSLKDGNAPFYIHKSQNRFMQKNPDSQFRIVRISLTDLDLIDEYKRLRCEVGKDIDPRSDEKLMKECRKIAEKYWKKAKIETFVSSSPEYSIKIER